MLVAWEWRNALTIASLRSERVALGLPASAPVGGQVITMPTNGRVYKTTSALSPDVARSREEISTSESQGAGSAESAGMMYRCFSLSPRATTLFTKGGEVTLVGVADLVNKAVNPRRFINRERRPLVCFGSLRRRSLFWKPLVLNSPRPRERKSSAWAYGFGSSFGEN